MRIAVEVVDNFQGYRDIRILDSAIAAARYQELYGGVSDPVVLAVHLMNNVQRQQALVDGSKRLGFALGFAFLEVNGYGDASAHLDAAAAADEFLALIEGKRSVDEFAAWLRERLETAR
jgi:prophage maintenance system killer protein